MVRCSAIYHVRAIRTSTAWRQKLGVDLGLSLAHQAGLPEIAFSLGAHGSHQVAAAGLVAFDLTGLGKLHPLLDGFLGF